MSEDFVISILNQSLENWREIEDVLPSKWELRLLAIRNLWQLVLAFPQILLVFLPGVLSIVGRWLTNRCRV